MGYLQIRACNKLTRPADLSVLSQGRMNLCYACIKDQRIILTQIKRQTDETFNYDELTVKQEKIFASWGFYLYRIRMINVLFSDKPEKVALKDEYENSNFKKGNKKNTGWEWRFLHICGHV